MPIYTLSNKLANRKNIFRKLCMLVNSLIYPPNSKYKLTLVTYSENFASANSLLYPPNSAIRELFVPA
jgi:hypothetical protein